MVDGISGTNSVAVNQVTPKNSSPVASRGEESKEVVSTKAEESREGGTPVTAKAAPAESPNQANGNLGRSVNIQA